MYLYIGDILLYKSPNPAYPGEFLHINNQRAHNNYKNIILKEPNENPQRANLGRRTTLWATLLLLMVLLSITNEQQIKLESMCIKLIKVLYMYCNIVIANTNQIQTTVL